MLASGSLALAGLGLRARIASRLFSAALLLGSGALLAACGTTRRADASIEDRDAPFVLDSDGDGLCDDTELSRGTDPSRADTDGDGFPDLVEIQIYADGLMIDSPDRDDLVVLPTERLATLAVPLTFSVRGTGGTYVGGFAARPRPLADTSSANDFYLRAAALAATPTANARLVEGERVLGVVGRTLLTYQVDFEYREDALIECMRAYPFAYQLKLQDGNIVGVQSRILVVAPRGMEPGRGEWCPVTDGCF